MPATARALVIDARPRGPRGPMAGERVMGRPVLAHLVEAARSCDSGTIAVHARAEEHAPMRSLVGDAAAIVFSTGPPPEHAAILRTDRLYDAGKLRRVLRSGRDPESAVVWRLDRPSALAFASDEMSRRRHYQPLGRFWALMPARALARALVPTRVRPNAVTIASASAMIGASAIVGWAPISPISRGLVAALMATGLVLDTADGHLARLQGTASEFGRWLDSVLDEACDMALHFGDRVVGICAPRARPAGSSSGMTYAIGKYLFVVAQQEAPPSIVKPACRCDASDRVPIAQGGRPTDRARRRALASVDLARGDWVDWTSRSSPMPLTFPLRTAALAARKAVRHG